MEGSIGSRVCRGIRSYWTSRRRSSYCYYYQRLPASGRPAGRGVRLGRRALTSPAWRLGRLRRAGTTVTWASPLQLLHRIVDAYVDSLLSHPLKALRASASPAPAVVASPSSSPPPKKSRREASSPGSSRRRDAGGRGVVLNLCVAEALLLRRSTSEVRPSPLRQPREAARCASARA